nr:MAG TPA: hypothetical protein [Caudoviricetes sp.]
MHSRFFHGFDSRTLLQKEPPPDRNGQAGFLLFSAASGVFPVRANMKTIHAYGRISGRKRRILTTK